MGRWEPESRTEMDRRAHAEKRERYLDLEENYNRDIAQAQNNEERSRLMSTFSALRSAYCQDEVAAGRRHPGGSIVMHQIMWVRWIEAAVEQERKAIDACVEILGGASARLLEELRASMLSLTASAYTVEALYGDIKYLVPVQKRRHDKRHQVLARTFGAAFSVLQSELDFLEEKLLWLFGLRDFAVHSYTEPLFPKRHPAGLNTGSEHADFNAVTSGKGVDAAMQLLDLAASSLPCNHWVERWSRARAPYMDSVVRPLQLQRGPDRERISKMLESKATG